jgi:hypothetical protein
MAGATGQSKLEKYSFQPRSIVEEHEHSLHDPAILAMNANDNVASTPESGVKKRKAGSPLAPLYASLEAGKDSSMDVSIIKKLIEALELKMDDMEENIEEQAMTIDILQKKCLMNEGRITRQEKLIEDLRENSLQLQAQLLHDNIAFYNIPEERNENVVTVLQDFLYNEMKVSEDDVSRVTFTKAYRMGDKGNAKRTRGIMAVVGDVGQNIIWSHTKNLKGKNFGVINHLPRELADRKRQLLPQYKAARAKNLKPKWSGEKLIIGGNVTEVKRDRVHDINVDTTEKAITMKVKRSPIPKTYKGSTFQGAKVAVNSTDEVISALHAIYKDCRSARATHNMYAYRIQSGDSIIEHYEDDGEHGGGRKSHKHGYLNLNSEHY